MSANRNVRISAPETGGPGSPEIVSSATIRRVYDPAHLLARPEARREPTIMPAPKRELERTRLQHLRGPTHPTQQFAASVALVWDTHCERAFGITEPSAVRSICFLQPPPVGVLGGFLDDDLGWDLGEEWLPD